MHKTLIVTDTVCPDISRENVSVITFSEYVDLYPQKNEQKVRIINLCDISTYLSSGYYCSLLAESRHHNVLPSVSTINDLRKISDDAIDFEFLKLPNSLLPKDFDIQSDSSNGSFNVYFGYTFQPQWQRLAKYIFDHYMTPIVTVHYGVDSNGLSISISTPTIAQLSPTYMTDFLSRLDHFIQTIWRQRAAKKQHRWDMAILVDPNEAQPPSNKAALKAFIQAASKIGIHAECITAAESAQLSQFDALFIRETTAIDHHTYALSRRAQREGIVVIDDPTSILRCCNKVYLHDAFSYNNIPSLKTIFAYDATETTISTIEKQLGYPVVIKQPESSFSKGVHKVENRADLIQHLSTILKETALVLVQEYLYTQFDWRIGVLNGRAIYACKYHMIKNHWQIYHHKKSRILSGGFETLPTFEVPKTVLDAAISACKVVGNGLYGVDIKQKGKRVCVVEVNDNPNIDHKIEDVYLGNELYMLIMTEFLNRLESRGK